MRTTLATLLLGFASVSGAMAAGDADQMPLYDGAWRLRLDVGGTAAVTLAGWEGTWRWGAAAPKACRGKALPVTVHVSTASELEFTAWGSTLSSACPDVGVSLKPVDARTLAGRDGAGVQVRMTRAARR